MITIVAEKPDVGSKIAAALDRITLENGAVVTFDKLKASAKAVKSQQAKDGFLKIRWQGQECYVTWGYGHLCELKQAADYDKAYRSWRNMPLPFIPEEYGIKLASNPKKDWEKKMHAQFKTVKGLMNRADTVINATDADREGEVIFAYIYELAGCRKPVKRAYFSSQTKQGLIDGFTKDLKDGPEMASIELAGRMRGIADWVVGANLTAALSLKRPGEGVISVGRVQTPTLAMVVEREKAVRSFKPEPYWTVEAEFTASGGSFKAKHEKDRFGSKKEAQAVLERVKGKEGKVVSVEKKESRKEVPNLYSLSALQMDANALYGYSLDTTLKIAQKLYEGGYITYPRTNSRFLTEDMEGVVNDTLDALAARDGYAQLIEGMPRKFDRRHYFDNSKVESHFAIIPTGTLPEDLTGGEAKVYDLVCRSLIRTLYPAAVFENTTARIDAAGEPFTAKGQAVKEAGWAKVAGIPKGRFLPELSEGMSFPGEYEILDKMTEPPKRYSEKSLLSAMLSAGRDLSDAELKKIMSDPNTGGIGTEATRAAIVETLVSRGYITRDKKTVRATDKGIELIDTLPVEDIKGAEMTAKWEQRLKDIEKGSADAGLFRRDIEEATRKWVAEIQDKVEAKGPEYAKKEKAEGNWNGKDVSFNRKWGEHTFSDEECGKLLSGESITFVYKGKDITGALADQEYKGHSYVGFKPDFGS